MNVVWVALSKIWVFFVWILCLILESLGKWLKQLGGKSSSEASSKEVRQPPPHHDNSYPREQYSGGSSYSRDQYSSGSDYPRDWPPYHEYPSPFSSYDSPPRGYPASYSYGRPEGYRRRDHRPRPSDYLSHRRSPPRQSDYPSHRKSPPRQTSSSRPTVSRPKLQRSYSKIADNYKSLPEVTDALKQAGLESSNLIVGIDFTKSNEWTGKQSFNGCSLHHIGDTPNPYEQAISIIGTTLSSFDEDNMIPCFGFGDASTHDQDVFSFYSDEIPCNGFPETLSRYREIVPQLRLSGPTSFAPIIEMAMTIVERSGGQYHVLLIIADGQVTRSVDTESGRLSPQERKTVDAIVKASEFPLSIILVGVGDGPWDMMQEFDDNIPSRSFDNFQFVNFTAIMSKSVSQTRKETQFALAALMEVPSQYKATLELGILGRRAATSPERVALPPPIGSNDITSSDSKQFGSTGYKRKAPSHSSDSTTPATAPPVATASSDTQVCPICLTNPRDMAFGCGHQTCCDCGPNLQSCPICRRPIDTRIKLY
ncbi:E3 ubiquitin-protein ligase RGLG5-like isoform X1 [Typha angustifolia]|uniref:E3 ubiquitin-protein ligase RGLG5-like isoform X1 n=1 Tax=Typha angustifolia TaxID=59011 RepID=UPI003C2EAF76